MANTPSYAKTAPYEEETEMKYDTFVKKALGWEKKDFFDECGEWYENYLFSELTDGAEALADTAAEAALAGVEMAFQCMQYSITIKNALIYDMLSQIDEQERNIVLMAEWLEMKDWEIADATGLKRRTVNNLRNKTYKKLKELLEAHGYEAGSFYPTRKK